MRGEPALEVRFARSGQGGLGASEFIHLGSQAPPDDRVAFVEPQTQRFAVEDLFAHPALDRTVHFGIGGCAAHHSLETESDTGLPLAREFDRPAGRIDRFARQCQPCPDHRPGDQEMRQRVAQPMPDHSRPAGDAAAPGDRPGFSQTGEE